VIPSVPYGLLDQMSAFADRDAIASAGQSVTYAQLIPRIEAWRSVLANRGLSAGSVVAVRGDYSPGICALFLAVTLQRGVVVALPLGEDVRPLLVAARAEALFDFAEDSDAWSSTALTPGTPPPVLERLRERGGAGLVVFTSGTTGQGKAALFDFDTLIKRYRKPRPGYRTLVFLKLDHLGGIHTMLYTLAHGGTLVVGDERQPEAVARAIVQHRIELLPTTPTFLRMLVISRMHERYDLSSLRLITYGTEPMPPSTLEALQEAFPGVGLKQTYGLTELGVLPTRSRAPGSLWLEVGGLGCEARVVDNVLWLRSETAMLGYLNAPSPFDEDGWYNTHDVVEVDGPYIRILGRTTELINVGGQKVYPSEVESALLELDNVSEVTVWGEANPVTGQVVAARVTLAQPEDQESFERRLHRFCRGRLADYKIPLVVEIVAGGHHGQRFKKIRPGPTTVVASGSATPV
jgi:acyl-CoA synthetase (AMP-forming)/AMP-acid ligase II